MCSLTVAKDGYDAFTRGDLETFLSLCDENIDWRYRGPAPWAGSCQGRGEVKRFFALLGGVIEFLSFDPDEFIVSGDDLAVMGRTKARVRASGGAFDNHWVHVLKVRNGKIARFVGYDTTALTARAEAGGLARDPRS